MLSEFKTTRTRKMHILRCMGSKFWAKSQMAPLIVHTTYQIHTPQNMHFIDFYISVWFTISWRHTAWEWTCIAYSRYRRSPWGSSEHRDPDDEPEASAVSHCVPSNSHHCQIPLVCTQQVRGKHRHTHETPREIFMKETFPISHGNVNFISTFFYNWL